MKKNIRTYLVRYASLIALCNCWAVPAYAQTLNVYDAVHMGITNYPLIQQRQAEIAASKAHITTVNGNRLPSFIVQEQVNMGTANSLDGAYFPSGIIPSTSGSINGIDKNTLSSGNIALSFLQWEFYNFGYYNAQKEEAHAQFAASEARMNSDTYLLSENIIALYLDWLKKYRLLQIEDENMQRAKTILNAIRATVISGLKPGVDSATAGASYSDARIAYLQALNDYNYDKISITTYTALDKENISPDTTIVSRAAISTIYQPESDSIAMNHPLLDVYQKQYEQQLAANKTIGKKYLPKLTFDGAAWARGSSISPTDVYSSDLSNGLSYSRYNYLLGLTLSYNLFDLKHRHDQLTEGRYLAQASQNALHTEQLSLNEMLQQANSAYATTTAKLKELPIQLHAAQQAYGQQLALYHSGLNTLIDVTNAQYVLKQTETNYVLAQDELLQLLYIRAGLDNQLDNFLQNFK